MVLGALLEYRLAWTVLRTPTTDAGEARLSPKPEYVEVTGTVEAEEPLETLVSRTECVAFKHMVEEYRRSGRSAAWRTVEDVVAAKGFYVRDESGRVYVDTGDPAASEIQGNAELRLNHEDVIEVDGGEEPPEDVARYLRRNDELDRQDDEVELGPISLPKDNPRRYRERRLEPGDEVYVLGQPVQGRSGHPEGVVLMDGPDTPDCVVSDVACSRGVFLDSVKKASWALVLGVGFLLVTYYFILPPTLEVFMGFL